MIQNLFGDFYCTTNSGIWVWLKVKDCDKHQQNLCKSYTSIDISVVQIWKFRVLSEKKCMLAQNLTHANGVHI